MCIKRFFYAPETRSKYVLRIDPDHLSTFVSKEGNLAGIVDIAFDAARILENHYPDSQCLLFNFQTAKGCDNIRVPIGETGMPRFSNLEWHQNRSPT